eukprot:4559202-Pleurochrysis_carterae.AAC.2
MMRRCDVQRAVAHSALTTGWPAGGCSAEMRANAVRRMTRHPVFSSTLARLSVNEYAAAAEAVSPSKEVAHSLGACRGCNTRT